MAQYNLGCMYDNGDGVLSRAEVRAMFKELGVRCSKDEFDAALKGLEMEEQYQVTEISEREQEVFNMFLQ